MMKLSCAVALTHPSVAHEKALALGTINGWNFGEPVLRLVLTRELYTRFPEADEGPLDEIAQRNW